MADPERIEQAKTPKEIERKFLVTNLPENFDHNPSSHIRQGYLEIDPISGAERRIRDKNGTYTETIKSGGSLTRTEVEYTLSGYEFDRLWPSTEGKRVEKNRFAIPYGDSVIELDIYGGDLQGLIVAEVEFPDEATAEAFNVPEWFGRDVTTIKAYKNQMLAQFGIPVLD